MMRGLPVRTSKLVHIYRSEGQDVAALSGVDFQMRAGELVGLLGPSGAGKSTLLALIAGLFAPSAGRIYVGDHEVNAFTIAALDRYYATDTSLMLQGASRNLLPGRTPLQNVTYAQRAARHLGHGVADPHQILADLDLSAQATTPTDQLPAAQRQLTALAAAVAAAPALLLADEPTSRLETEDREVVLDALRGINARYGTTILVVTHDRDVAAALPRTVTIRDGRIGGEGRRGQEFAVVTADGYLPVPPHLLDKLPPGTLVHFDDDHEDIRLITQPRDPHPGTEGNHS